KKKKRARKTCLTSKEKRALGVHDIAEGCRKYDLFAPLNALWKGIWGSFGTESGSRGEGGVFTESRKADLHGAIMTVTRSRCPSHVGLTGICVKETENTFHLIHPQNRLVIIPKPHTVFCFHVPAAKDGGIVVTLFGDHFKGRAADRTTKKFKGKASVEL
ncbi:Rof/RNase P-like protein, partial [Chytridium lagenaria]